jgi:signal transduction histidine kinase
LLERRLAMRTRLIHLSTLAAVGASLVGVGLGVWLAVLNRGVAVDAPVPEPVGGFIWVQMVSAVVWAAAAIVMLRRPDIGWSTLCSVAALSHATAAVSYGWAVRVFVVGASSQGGDLAVWLTLSALPVEVLALNWMAMTVPDGRLPRGRLRWLTVATVGMTVFGLVAASMAELDIGGTDFARAHHPLSNNLTLPGFMPVMFLAPTAPIVLGIVWARWRASVGDVRLAMRRIVVISVLGLVIPSLMLARPDLAVGVAQVIGALQILAFIAVVLRHRLFGIDSLLERALRFTLLTGLLLVLYVALVAVGDAVFDESLGPFAAVAVALVALPAHDVLCRSVALFMYGDRDHPERVVASVIRRAGVAAAPDEMVRDVLGEVAAGLRLDHVAICDSASGKASVEIGETGSGQPDRFDLIHRGRLVGVLEASPRAGEDGLTVADRAALVKVSDHLASMVDAATSAVALRESRERLVHVREEERRRLRRDLHDGLGPVLTGAALTTDAALNSIDRDPQKAKQLLGNARAELTGAIEEIRRLVEDLRPPSIDELGLVGSIKQHAQRFPQLHVNVTHALDLPVLPAAVEVAAYRIATEALTNVARHANATRATVGLHLNGQLEVRIEDDGHNTAPWVPGVGLTSMNERATEIGGTVTAGPNNQGGRVVAALPVEP